MATQTPSRTVRESSEYEIEYRSPIQPRTASRGAHRRSSGAISPGPQTGSRVLKIVSEMGSGGFVATSPALTKDAAESFVKATAKEKEEMQTLNDRLASYIDRVKNLEQQHRKLVADLEELRGKWGQNTREIKVEFAIQLKNARKAMDDAARLTSDLEVKIARLEEEIRDIRLRFDDAIYARNLDRDKTETYVTQMADYRAEMEMMHARLKSLSDEMQRYERDNGKLLDELKKVQSDLDNETISRIDFQNQTQTLLEELEFLRNLHDKELRELQGLLLKEPVDSREFFKNELALAIRDIRDEYDLLAQANKADMESWYKLKVSEVQGASGRGGMESEIIREEVKRMRTLISDIRGKLADLDGKNGLLERQVRELIYQLDEDARQYEGALNDREATLNKMRMDAQALVVEMQALLDSKHILDAEIAIYRKMLDSEEVRSQRQVSSQVTETSYSYTSHSAELASRERGAAEPAAPPRPRKT